MLSDLYRPWPSGVCGSSKRRRALANVSDKQSLRAPVLMETLTQLCDVVEVIHTGSLARS